MAFSKIAGLDVTPRSESSSTSRCSSPDSISERRIWSSHTLVPGLGERREPLVRPVPQLPSQASCVIRSPFPEP